MARAEDSSRRSSVMIDEKLSRAATLDVPNAPYGARAIVVAGGETSGAVVERLGVGSLALGPEVDPGVAWSRGLHDGEDIHLMLKSGNFGAEDLFVRAWGLNA